MSDLIERQAAIDIERNATVDTNPSHFEAHQKFTQFMDDAEISSFGRWQWSNGFNTALTAVGVDLKRLPSAQPERKTGEWISCKTQLPPTTMICHCTIQREGYLGSDVKDRSMIDLVYDEPDHKWRRLSGIQLSADYRVVAWMQAAEVYGGE